eukprot:13066556-Heterocapsa_arctica.AAC.1
MPGAVISAQLATSPGQMNAKGDANILYERQQLKLLEEAVLQHYQLPCVDSTRFLLKHPALWAKDCQNIHPQWYGRQLLADRIAYIWGRLWNSACGAEPPT